MITRRQVITAALLLAAVVMPGFAQEKGEWQDPGRNEVNRLPMHADFFAYESEAQAQRGEREQSANYMTLNGMWRFNWVKDADQRPTDFWRTDYNDKGWAEMPVPGVWELNGYGDPVYLNVGYPWREQFKSNPPEVPTENNHVGSYRKEVTVPASWNGKQIIAHFGSVTSNIYLWVNGRYVGYSEDSKLEAEFDLTPYVKTGQKNLIAFQVFRWCDGTYLEDQDFMRYSGVARDSYLYARGKQHISDVRATPDLDGQYQDGTLDVRFSVAGSGTVNARLTDAAGNVVAEQNAKASANGQMTFNVENPHKWSAETPYLYTMTLSLGNTEFIPIKVGFRKVEIKNSQVLVNGQPVLFKGADRHEMDPDGGYVISRERMEQDIQIMKQFNLNAVRTCHYPDDNYWYDLCDKYGLYMVAEANLESHGMGYGDATLAKRDDYRLAHMQRNQRNVQRNFNHPAIIFWSLGNEAGYGPNFEAAYDWVKAEDPSRPVQYERAGYDGKSDIYCPMYLNYKGCEDYATDASKTKPLIQCEYAHAMGNSEGGFKEYWDLIRKYPKYQGGFIWDFVDQSPRWQKNGVTIYGYGGDFNAYDASDQNFCDNGLISPDRVPNPHMYEVGYYYQNIWTTLKDAADGTVDIYNENFFRDLSDYYLEWELLHNGKPVRTGRIDNLDVEPQQHKTVSIDYGQTCKHCEWLLNVSYKLKHADGLLPAAFTVARDQLVINQPQQQPQQLANATETNVEPTLPQLRDNDQNFITVRGTGFAVDINKQTGMITRYEVGGKSLLKSGEAITPNFWRAPTDNDFGARTNVKYAVWKNPELKLTSLKQSMDADGMAVIEAQLDMPATGARLTLTYHINNIGAIQITEKLTAGTQGDVPNMFRFGMQMPMPRSYETLEYYGRGPQENYADRNHSTFLGIYRQSVSSQFYPYIRPQENGNKTDLRYWELLDESGSGVKITADAPFSASALHYTIASLDEGTAKHNMHSQEVPEADLTNVLIDLAQAGLGCVDSWYSLPLPQYQLPCQDYSFNFVITPVQHKIEAGD